MDSVDSESCQFSERVLGTFVVTVLSLVQTNSQVGNKWRRIGLWVCGRSGPSFDPSVEGGEGGDPRTTGVLPPFLPSSVEFRKDLVLPSTSFCVRL